MNAPIAGLPQPSPPGPTGTNMGSLVLYFLKLGATGFGGPAALVGYMRRDLVERRGWVDEDTYKLALALAQIMPGPLAAQCAIALGYFQAGILGATLVGLAFILPSFLMVLVLSALYVAYDGLWWMQATFYGIGAAVIAIIAIQAYNLARRSNRSDRLSWGIFAVLAAVTAITQSEIAYFFILAGLLVMVLRAPPAWLKTQLPFASLAAAPAFALAQTTAPPVLDTLLRILLFFGKAGLFVFGSGLAIVPFLYQGVVLDYGWLTEQQFLDAVAVAMITPGPVVITVAFIGYLVAGAVAAAIGIFVPVYVLTIVPAPWFKRHRDNAQLKAFVQGATAAATGAIAGAVVVLALRTIVDIPTIVIAFVSLVVLWRWKIPEPILVAASGVVGLVLWRFLRGVG